MAKKKTTTKTNLSVTYSSDPEQLKKNVEEAYETAETTEEVEVVYDPEDDYRSQDELDPVAAECSEKLNHLLYMVHADRFSENQLRKLRAQLATVNVE